ncbi:MAG: ZIP family metal transporter [Clostridia bacterium]|nr:ZIP family metal transporter [Clostridia bacterium]
MFFNALFMSVLGIFSSLIGGAIPFFIKIKSVNRINCLYEFVSGIMVGIVCISMIPESIQISGIMITLLGIILGTFFIFFIDLVILKRSKNNKFHKLILIIFSMAFHNIIEGIAVGASLEYSFSLGITIFLAMFLHDIPEGMIVGVANLDSGKSKYDLVKNSFIVGIFSGIGIFIGIFFGSISDLYTSLSLSVSSGAMLYIVTKTFIPTDGENTNSHLLSFSFILGILLSAMITKL